MSPTTNWPREIPSIPREYQKFRKRILSVGHPFAPYGAVKTSRFNSEAFSDLVAQYEETATARKDNNVIDVYKLTKFIGKRFAVRAEAVSIHVTKDKDTKFWEIFHEDRELKSERLALKQTWQKYYRNVIIWMFQNGYDDSQIAEVTGNVTPPTVRMVRNQWGYKNYTIVRAKGSSRKGAVGRKMNKVEQKHPTLFDQIDVNKITPDMLEDGDNERAHDEIAQSIDNNTVVLPNQFVEESDKEFVERMQRLWKEHNENKKIDEQMKRADIKVIRQSSNEYHIFLNPKKAIESISVNITFAKP